jgi:exonuclease SbcC
MRANSLLLAELTKAATRHQEAAQMIAKKGELEVKVMELESRYERLRSDYARSSEHAKRCGERDLALTRVNALRLSPPENKSEAEPTAEWLRTRSQVLTEEVEHLRAQRIEREGELARLRETGECFVCLRPLGEPHDHDRVLSILTSKIAELEASEDKCVRELVEIAKELPETQERERALSEVVRALAGAEAVLAQALTRVDELEATGEINADLVELQARGRAAADELEVARNELAAAAAATAGLDEEAQSKIAKLKEVMEEEREQLQTAEKAMGEDYDEEVIINRRAEVIALRDQLLAYEAKVPEMAKHAQMQEQAQATAERELASLSDKLDKLEEVQRQALRLEDLQTYLGGFQRKLASDIRPALEEMGSEMLDQVSGGKHVAMRIDDSYEIEVQSAEGSWLPSLLLSGGELIRVNICLRLALTRLVSQRTGTPARFLVLDEPLPSQDAGHVQRIMELLDSLRAFYPQIYIISHVGDLRSANEIDYVLEFESSGSERIALNFA